jgi:hypothetical protein
VCTSSIVAHRVDGFDSAADCSSSYDGFQNLGIWVAEENWLFVDPAYLLIYQILFEHLLSRTPSFQSTG